MNLRNGVWVNDRTRLGVGQWSYQMWCGSINLPDVVWVNQLTGWDWVNDRNRWGVEVNDLTRWDVGQLSYQVECGSINLPDEAWVNDLTR